MSFDLYFSYDNVTISLDVDECKQRGGETGHYCHSNTKCVNSLGSYTCECLPGYRRLDKFNCVELDECTSGKHSCDSHAVCINTLGSYHCQCQDGYSGDGFKCERKYFSNFVSLKNNQLTKNILGECSERNSKREYSSLVRVRKVKRDILLFFFI